MGKVKRWDISQGPISIYVPEALDERHKTFRKLKPRVEEAVVRMNAFFPDKDILRIQYDKPAENFQGIKVSFGTAVNEQGGIDSSTCGNVSREPERTNIFFDYCEPRKVEDRGEETEIGCDF